MPRAKLRMNSSATTSPATATTPATQPASRCASRNVNAKASSPPAWAITSHSSGAQRSPVSANGVVNSTGSGFHDGPVRVSSAPSVISRPQMIHAHGS